jgi:type II secretory ATPase GspE/PulE/Tfp pilus assembly ATPase PilB-like protein
VRPAATIDDVLGEIVAHVEYAELVVAGLTTRPHFRAAALKQAYFAEFEGRHVTVRSLLEEDRFLQAAGDRHEVVARHADAERLVHRLPAALMIRLAVVPVRLDDGCLRVASIRPLPDSALAEIQVAVEAIGFRVESVVGDCRPLSWVRDRLAEIGEDKVQPFTQAVRDMRHGIDEEGATRRAFDALLGDALRWRASDLSISLSETTNNCRFDYRIDGSNSTRHYAPHDAGRLIVGLIKLRAQIMDAERDKPQDGRFDHLHQGRHIDVRVNCTPVLGGEAVTMRLLDPAQWGDLPEILACAPALRECLEATLRRQVKSGGDIIFTGPTGHGKSTTLAALISAVNRDEFKVITIEEPIEYRLPKVDQMQVTPGLPGRSFPDLVRNSLRQDPDVVVLTELRDAETVEEWLRCLDSGHLSPVTLHGDTIFDAVNRVMGYLDRDAARRAGRMICQKMIALVNQRLFRRVCINCSELIPVNQEMRDLHTLPLDIIEVRQAGPGCSSCNGGHVGRICLPEYLLMPQQDLHARDRILTAMVDDGRESAIRDAAAEHFRPRSAAAKVALHRGWITLDGYLEACST